MWDSSCILDHELMLELDLAAAAKLESEAGSEKLRAGLRLLDTWHDRAYGAVLFWVDRPRAASGLFPTCSL